MSYLIDRQAAIDAVRQYCKDNQIEDGDYHSNGIEYELNNLPSAQPEPQWIPIYKDKPKAWERVLLCLDNNEITIGWWSDEYNKFDWWDDSVDWYDGVIAWMPLPKAYRGGQENETD